MPLTPPAEFRWLRMQRIQSQGGREEGREGENKSESEKEVGR
jgi:hypothetical protein